MNPPPIHGSVVIVSKQTVVVDDDRGFDGVLQTVALMIACRIGRILQNGLVLHLDEL